MVRSSRKTFRLSLRATYGKGKHEDDFPIVLSPAKTRSGLDLWRASPGQTAT